MKCKCEWCNSEDIYCKGMCNRHYLQMQNHGKLFKTMYDPNDIIIYSDYAEIVIRNKQGDIKAIAVIDIEDLEMIGQYKWNESGGYARTVINGHGVFMHKIIMNDINNNFTIDHINRNRLDNRKSNLRFTTIQENSLNQSVYKNNVSGVPGVRFNKSKKKWEADIQYKRKRIYLGSFMNKDDAIAARKSAEEKYFGDYAPKNQ